MWECHKSFYLRFHQKVKNFLCCQCLEPPCALIFCLTGLPLIGTRRHEEALWRFFVGMTSPQISFYSSGSSWGGIQRARCDEPKCCMQHLLCGCLTQGCFAKVIFPRLGSLTYVKDWCPIAHWLQVIILFIPFYHVEALHQDLIAFAIMD